MVARAGQTVRRAWWAFVRRLDRPGRRGLLVVPASLWVSGTYRAPCLVTWQDGVWIHHYRDAKIPHAVLGRAAPPDVFTAEARDIFLYGYTPRPGDTVFDVGAGVGAETLLFARLVGRLGRVVSLEAHPGTHERLARLVAVNKLANVTPLQVAASNVDGEVSITDSDRPLRNTIVEGESSGIPVRARRIDTVARELGITTVDLLKMNIEGAEQLAVRGLGGLIGAVRHVCISCHDFLADDGGAESLRTKANVRDFLVDNGFHVTTREDALDPWTRDYLYGTNTR
jgi:FkbM family methyltransferase